MDEVGAASTPDPGEQQLIDWLRQARYVIAFCGAGISAESGVTTFRGSGGLWSGYRVEEVASPEGFAVHPQRVWQFYAERLAQLPTVEPNPAHRTLAAMERHYPHCAVITQNVDDLHERAGSRHLVKLHGSLREVRCTRSGETWTPDTPADPADVAAGRLPRCRCGALLRPNVVWFGEFLDPAALAGFREAFTAARNARPGEAILLVIGTSGEVSAGYGVTTLARRIGAHVVEINPVPGLLSEDADLILPHPAGELLERVWPRTLEVGSRRLEVGVGRRTSELGS